MKRKEAVYKGLQFNDVWFTDTSLTSPNYFQITEFPNKLTAGKNLFKLRGHPTNLKVGGYLNIEVLDYNGDPIYHEIVNYIDEDKSRVVAIYIYEDTSPGDCVVTLTAEAVNVPLEWQGRANIKWNRQVPVNPNVSNDSEIIFENLPTVTITEQVGTQLDRTFPSGLQFPTYNTGTVKYYLLNNQPAIELNGGSFTSDMSTGTITVATPVNALPTATYIPSTTTYSSTIKKILSPSLALLDSAYTVFSSQSISSHTYSSFDASTFSLPYEASPIYTPTENSESFALIQISGLQPATGDVSRIKTFMNNNGQVGTWELINDIELIETEIFVANTASLYPDTSIGLFTSQSIIDTYWEAHTYQGRTETTAPTLIYTTSSISNAMAIVSATDITALNAVHVVQIKDAFNGIFVKDASYKITLDALGIKSGTQDAKLSVYLSGSAFDFDSTDYFNQELPKTLGKRIGDISVNTAEQRFDDYVFNFEASNNGTAVLLLVVEAGTWQVADIRTTSDNDAGYTPDYTRIRSLVPTAHKSNNQLTFKVEYYNFAGVKSKQINYLYNKNWEGGNRYVDGDYSMLTGSLYVADSLESGIAISGYADTGFVRSLGYQGFDSGFPGFLLWSGSALSGQNTKGGVPYSGVGLELYGNANNYFRYSTNPSELDVHTETFFLGNPTSQYISGSNGNLEISSSGFYLTANGDVTASSFIAVNGADVLFDSNAEFIDGKNVGRVVYFDQSETIINISAGVGDSAATAQTASIFQTFILPGETSLQVSYTYQIQNNNVSDSIVINSNTFIETASLGPTVGTSAYGQFIDSANIRSSGFTSLGTSVPASTTESGADNKILTAGNTFSTRQGMYVQIYFTIFSPSTSPDATVKLKNFVFRTSRTVGSSIIPPAIPIFPST
jgi:hypothetical protein